MNQKLLPLFFLVNWLGISGCSTIKSDAIPGPLSVQVLVQRPDGTPMKGVLVTIFEEPIRRWWKFELLADKIIARERTDENGKLMLSNLAADPDRLFLTVAGESKRRMLPDGTHISLGTGFKVDSIQFETDNLIVVSDCFVPLK